MRLRPRRREATPAPADPLTQLDRDLARLAADLRAMRLRGEDAMVERLTELIDLRLELRGRVTARLPDAAVRDDAMVHGEQRTPPTAGSRSASEG